MSSYLQAYQEDESQSCGKAVLNDKFNIKLDSADEFVIALAGTPNVGKSTVFNSLTGLNQHTGNWFGKTVSNARGNYTYKIKNKRNHSRYRRIREKTWNSVVATTARKGEGLDQLLYRIYNIALEKEITSPNSSINYFSGWFSCQSI